MPKVSVIIPVYGVEKYIERCARSLFEQTLDDIEYLFIDDCTPDDSIGILKTVFNEYPQRKTQVIIHRMEINSGQAVVREFGMKHATGDYVIHCDSDDWIDTSAYKEMYELAIMEDADVVVCDFYNVGEYKKSKVLGCHNSNKEIFFKNIISQRDQGALWNKMFKRTSCFKDVIWAKGDMGEDMLMCLQFVYNASKVVHLPKAFYYYYNNPLSISSAMSKEAIVYRFQQSIANANDLVYFFKRNGIYEQYSDEVDRVLFSKKNQLLPLIGEMEYYTLWKNTFSELNYKVLFNSNISFVMKIKHILALMKLYCKIF